MSTRIEPGVRTVSWTVTESVAIGHHDCDCCGVETPAPPDDALIAFLKARPRGIGGTLWPGRGNEQWVPPGWSVEYGMLLCRDCTDAVWKTIASRRKK